MTHVRSVRVSDRKWSHLKRCCNLPDDASATEVFEKMFTRVERFPEVVNRCRYYQNQLEYMQATASQAQAPVEKDASNDPVYGKQINVYKEQ